jgi:hypothetical protein
MKNVIVIKNPGNEIFEQAIFILRPNERSYSRKHIIKEARRIMAEKAGIERKNSKLFGK